MNSVKYSNWKDAVRAHQPGGFNSEVAWEKFQQREPKRKKKGWLPWLAAACLCGMLFSVLIFNNNHGTAARQPGNTVPVKNNRAEEQPVQARVPVGPVNNTVSFNEQEAPAAKEQTATKHIQHNAARKEQEAPVIPEPVNLKPEEPANNTTAVMAKAEPVKEVQPATAKPVLRVVHINELNTRTDYAQDNTPPEKRPAPVMPFMKPSYAQNSQEEAPPPVQKQQRGLLRSIASLKE